MPQPSRIIFAPDDPFLWNQWKIELTALRDKKKTELAYSDSLYTTEPFRWASRCYTVCMLMLFDQRFYNAETKKYDVDAILREGFEQFGGYDGVVLWHAYPRIGFDDRNQFDFYREVKELKQLVNRLHQKGVRVFIDYNPWDTGTKREEKKDIDVLAGLVKDIDADGIFLDTMNESAKEFRKKLDSVRPGTVLESELELPTDRIADHHMSWAQWWDDSHVPGVLWNKWFERRHMLHMIRRWDEDHSLELQSAWMNGCGMIVWENIFGTANKWNERDKSILKLMAPVQRRDYSVFTGEGWDPLYKVELNDVYSNRWYNDSFALWTLVNRSDVDKRGILFKIKSKPGIKYYDLVNGTETGDLQKDSIIIKVEIKARSIGAILAINKENIDSGFIHFLHEQAEHNVIRMGSSHAPLVMELVKPHSTVKYEVSHLPPGMCKIEKSVHTTSVAYTDRECGFYNIPGKTGQPLTDKKRIIQKIIVSLSGYAIDLTPVTNEQFYAFIKATHYTPLDTQQFLKHWIHQKPPKGKEQDPVVCINLDDARAYASWAGKRLPTEQEWQYAAEGPHQWRYPWGNIFKNENCNNGQFHGTTAVTKFKNGRSAFGCYDMCGNTWEWTESERNDGLTRFCIIKGGSYYKAKGSVWYTDGGAQPANFSAKFIMISPGLDRCATIGFRCAADLEE